MLGPRIAKIGPLKGLCGDAGAGLYKGIYRGLIGILPQYWRTQWGEETGKSNGDCVCREDELDRGLQLPQQPNKDPIALM